MSNRRDFIKLGGNLTAGLALSPIAGKLMIKKDFGSQAKEKLFGLQLYSLREDMPKDPKGVLKQVASFGYKQVEGFEGPMGIYWGMSNTEFKKYMDDLGMNFLLFCCRDYC